MLCPAQILGVLTPIIRVRVVGTAHVECGGLTAALRREACFAGHECLAMRGPSGRCSKILP